MTKFPRKFIKMSDLKNIDVVGSPKTLRSIYQYFMSISKRLGFEFSDLTIFFEVDQPDFPTDLLEMLSEYKRLESEEAKEEFRQKEIVNRNIFEDFLNDYEKLEKERKKRLKNLPAKLVKFWLENEDELNKVIVIIQKAVYYQDENIDIEVIEETDHKVLAEIIIRLFLDPDSAIDHAFFFTIIQKAFREFIGI